MRRAIAPYGLAEIVVAKPAAAPDRKGAARHSDRRRPLQPAAVHVHAVDQTDARARDADAAARPDLSVPVHVVAERRHGVHPHLAQGFLAVVAKRIGIGARLRNAGEAERGGAKSKQDRAYGHSQSPFELRAAARDSARGFSPGDIL